MATFSILAEEPCNGTHSGFANALTVWLNKPHVVNRRLCGSRLEYFSILPKTEISNNRLHAVVKKLGLKICNNVLTEWLLETSEISATENNKTEMYNMGNNSLESIADLSDGEIAVIIRQMLPKQPERHDNLPELVIFDKSEESCTFIALIPVDGSIKPPVEVVYRFTFQTKPDKRICLYTSSTDCSIDSERKLSLTWIKGQLLPKLAKWSEQPSLRTNVGSLCLISVEDYSRLYSELKNKYGIPIAKNWPEKTSAQKFVFEDVAIATYLLLLWEDDRRKKGSDKKQSFVDLGCGNGLLVHILASEGHPGCGIDVRKRNIWDMYGPETILKEMSITPSSDCLFPDCDWLIGNHSDELTPWIPVIAARSSYKCNFFLLPCCFWDFNSKYRYNQKCENSVQGMGKYQIYLEFVKTVGEQCGFIMEEDKLRIPSTKSVCFIGRSRYYDLSQESEVDQQRQTFISSRCTVSPENISTINYTHEHDMDGDTTSAMNTEADWVLDFKPRSQTEVTRNCVTVRQETKDHVIHTVFSRLLQCDNCEIKQRHDGKTWNKGGRIGISDVVVLFDNMLLQELKSECGGLQTLLRNSSHIFQVSGGIVQLRDFTRNDPFEGRRRRTEDSDRSEYLKTTLCWYYEHHPDGCPKDSLHCSYAHGLTELRPKPPKVKR